MVARELTVEPDGGKVRDVGRIGVRADAPKTVRLREQPIGSALSLKQTAAARPSAKEATIPKSNTTTATISRWDPAFSEAMFAALKQYDPEAGARVAGGQ